MSDLAYALSEEQQNIAAEYIPPYPQNTSDLPDYLKPSKAGLYVDEATYWDQYYESDDFRYEWNNGILEVKDMPTFFCRFCNEWFYRLIMQFLDAFPIAYVFTYDLGFKMTLPQKTAIRLPDVSIILKNNPKQFQLKEKSYKGIFDICIEFVSHSKLQYILNDIVKKKREYSQANVKEYYVIDSEKKHTAFYRLNTTGRYVKIRSQKGVIRSSVLTGFQFKIEDIYNQPDFNAIMTDPVYQSYVKLDLQKKNAALQEKNAALIEKDAALKEKDAMIKEKDTLINALLEEAGDDIKNNKRIKQLLFEKGIIL